MTTVTATTTATPTATATTTAAALATATSTKVEGDIWMTGQLLAVAKEDGWWWQIS
jgi:hypothetical protein